MESDSCSVVSDSLWPHYDPWNSPGQNTGVGSLFLLQGVFPTQGLNPGLPHCRQILCQLSHKESPRILERVACPFSSESSRPRNGAGVSCTAGGFLPTERSGKPVFMEGEPCLFSSVQFSLSVVSNSLWPHELQHARPPCPSPIPGVHPNSCPSSRWCHPAISSSVVPFSSCPQSLPASGSFPMSQLFAWGSQSIGVSASASVLPMNTQDWSPLGWTGLISLQSKGLSRVFSSTTVQKHQFFGAQLFHSPTFTSIHDHWKNYSLD